MRAGNRAAQRYVQRRLGALIQRDDTLYIDEDAVAHKEPDQSKTPNVIHMDDNGVGHEHPDGSKTPQVLYMDETGTGHDKPDQSETPEVLYMDQSGVGHEAPDEVDADIAKVKAKTQKHHDSSKALAKEITGGMAGWAPRLALAEQAKADAATSMATGKGMWDTEHKDAGEFAAQWAEDADTKAQDAQKHHDDTVPEHLKVQEAYNKLAARQDAFKKNFSQFRRDRRKWRQTASPMTKEAIDSIGALFRAEESRSKVGLDAGSKADAELAKFKTAWDDAAKSADGAWKALKNPSGAGFVIIGHLQQKLNATRPDGSNRIPVHALFDNTTEARLRGFQTNNGLTVTGRANSATWAELNNQAPSVMENGQLTVRSKEGAQSADPLNGNINPEVSFGDKGMAVKEIQQRLNNWNAAQGTPQFTALTVDGSFGFRDRWALQKFQKAVGLPDTGWANHATWAELNKVAGAVTGGTRQFDWRESVEGISNVGTTAMYDWEVKDGTLTISVKIQFTGLKGHPMVTTWLTDIKEVWNNYKAVEQGTTTPREFNVNFNPIQDSSGFHKVNVGQPTTANPNPRSDSANWYVNDTRRGLAPHEFGHLIGLVDEYNRPEEQGVAASGLEPAVGQTGSTSGAGSVAVADQIHAILTGNGDKTSDERLGLVVAKLREHGVVQGAFARLVAWRYQTKYGFDGTADMAAYFAKHNSNKWTTNLTRATTPFLTSNTSLMGTMESNMDRSQDMTALVPHEHPVQPRHIRDFANLMKLAIPGTEWKPERR